MTTERSGPRIRTFLDLSTNNFPQEVSDCGDTATPARSLTLPSPAGAAAPVPPPRPGR
jgi:hypothetical protein